MDLISGFSAEFLSNLFFSVLGRRLELGRDEDLPGISTHPASTGRRARMQEH